jgi:hypothetical protein
VSLVHHSSTPGFPCLAASLDPQPRMLLTCFHKLLLSPTGSQGTLLSSFWRNCFAFLSQIMKLHIP